MTASKQQQQQTKPAMTNTDTDSLDKGFQNHFVLLGTNVLADHLLVHLWVFLQERGHLHGVQRGGQQPLLLQERNPFGRLLVEVLCALEVGLHSNANQVVNKQRMFKQIFSQLEVGLPSNANQGSTRKECLTRFFFTHRNMQVPCSWFAATSCMHSTWKLTCK